MTDMNEVVTNYARLAEKQEDAFYYRVKLRYSDVEYEGPFVVRDFFVRAGWGKDVPVLVGEGRDGSPQFQPGLGDSRVQLIRFDEVVSFELGSGSQKELKPPKR